MALADVANYTFDGAVSDTALTAWTEGGATFDFIAGIDGAVVNTNGRLTHPFADDENRGYYAINVNAARSDLQRIHFKTTSQLTCVCVRLQAGTGGATGYEISIEGNDIKLYRVVNGTRVKVDEGFNNRTLTHEIRVTASGDRIIVDVDKAGAETWVNDTFDRPFDYTDPNPITGGLPGVHTRQDTGGAGIGYMRPMMDDAAAQPVSINTQIGDQSIRINDAPQVLDLATMIIGGTGPFTFARTAGQFNTGSSLTGSELTINATAEGDQSGIEITVTDTADNSTAVFAPFAITVDAGQWGVLGSTIPDASFFYDDLSLPADNNKRYRFTIDRHPTGARLHTYPDGAYTWDGSADSFDYTLYENNISVGSGTINITRDSAVTPPIEGENVDVRSEAVNVTAGNDYSFQTRYSATINSGNASFDLYVLFDTGAREYAIEAKTTATAAGTQAVNFTAPAGVSTAQIVMEITGATDAQCAIGETKLYEVA